MGASTIAQNEAQSLLDVVFGEYRPNQVVAWKRAAAHSAIPLLVVRFKSNLT